MDRYPTRWSDGTGVVHLSAGVTVAGVVAYNPASSLTLHDAVYGAVQDVDGTLADSC